MDASTSTGLRASSSYPYPRLTQAATAFVFSLCVPYIAAASPLPGSTPLLTAPPSSLHGTSMRALASLAGAATRIPRRSYSHPTIAIASYDPEGYVRLPQNYVALVQHFNGGFIALSYIIALIGSMCTLELLIRRTTNSGWRNQVLLLAAGLTFGSVSTFSMHFIFNNSLSLHHPLEQRHDYPPLYLAYDAGFTVLSLVVTCLAMTMAFFIMGTTLADWPCLPHSRRKRARKNSRGDGAAAGVEYANWKSSHQKVMRRGTMNVGSLLHQAGSVAKWSLVSGSSHGEEEKGWPRISKSAKEEKWAGLANEDEMIRQDDELRDLDFRLGRSAVKLALERRQGSVTSHDHETPFLPRPESVRHMSSNASLPRHPSPMWTPPSTSRRGSAIDPSMTVSSELFTPGFSFPSRSDPDSASSTVNLLPSSAPPSATLPGPLYIDATASHWVPDLSGRRASLPLVASPTVRPEPTTYRNALTLSRIQSLPENDAESPKLPSASGSYDKKVSTSPLSITVKLDALRPDASPERSLSKKRVRLVDKQFNKLQKFLGFDVVTRADITKVFFTGTVAGFGVVSMHYIGQLSITGMPYIAYKAPYVVGSVIIACGAVIIALYIMFIMLRPKLKHNWVSKVIVAIILSLAVTAMHFCGMMGTIYGWPRGKGISTHNRLTGTNRAITGIVAALAFVACLGCIMFFVFHSLKLRKERARRRRVVVAAVFLDAQDRILVNSTDGLLPMCDIASLSGATDNSSSHRSVRSVTQSFNSDATVLGMDLTTGHDAFVSALRMSWSWRQPSLSQINNGVTPSDSADQPGAPTLASIIADIRRESSSTVESGAAGGSKQMRLSVTKFLERFALSSGQLAARLIGTQNGISRLGVLYDQILTTGWVKLNNSNDTVSKGQLIFLVRRIASAAERDDLAAKNFIFADSASVAASLHKTLSVPLEHIVPLLEDVRTWCDGTVRNELKPGVLYTGVAVVQATPFDGLRILLERDQRARLPMRELCTFGAPAGGDELSGTIEEIGEAITWLDGMTLLSVIARNMTVESDPVGGPRVAQLLAAIERALIPMLDEMLTAEDMAHILPRLTLHPMIVPLLPGSQGPHIIVFYANYDAAVNTFTDKWLPFSLFRAQNACVMAPYIQAALRAEPLLSPIPTARRPSKVQFEFPVVQSQVQGQGGDGTFGSYAFPPRTDSIIPATNSGSGSHRCQSVPRRSSLARTRFGSIDKFADPDPQSPMASGFTTMQHSPERDKAVGLAGVADWEAEWLLMLLRNKLHAEA